MKSFRTAIILFAVLVVAGGAYWFFDIKKKKDKTERKEKEALLFQKSEKKIAQVVIREKGSGPIIVRLKAKAQLEQGEQKAQVKEGEGKGKKKKKGEEAAPAEEQKDEDEWIVVSPVQTGGDKTAIDGLITSLREAKRDEVVMETLEKEEEYGLSDPELAVEFTYEGEDRPNGISFGVMSLDRKKIFSKLAGKEQVVAVPAALKDALRKSLFDVREKRIAPFKNDEVVLVAKVSAMENFVIEKEEDGWYFQAAKPENRVKALESRVDLYTGYLRWGNIAEVIEEKGSVAKWRTYGLDRPRLAMTFKLADGSNFLFLLGNPVKQGDAEFYYAARSSDAMVFQVTADTANKLAMTQFEIKDRHIFTFSPLDVVKASFKYGDQDFTVEKDGEDWKFPGAKEPLTKAYAIENTVFAVSSAEYEDVPPMKKGDPRLAFTGIEDAKFTITLFFNDNREPLSVKVTDKDQESKCFMTPDGGATVYRIFGYFIANLPEKKDALME